MTPAKLRADAARELLASMEAERQAYAAPKCCTDAAQGGGLCLDHMLSRRLDQGQGVAMTPAEMDEACGRARVSLESHSLDCDCVWCSVARALLAAVGERDAASHHVDEARQERDHMFIGAAELRAERDALSARLNASHAERDAATARAVAAEQRLANAEAIACNQVASGTLARQQRDVWEQRAEAAEKALNRFDCAECGKGVAADEDHCCATCGSDCDVCTQVDWRARALAAEAELDALICGDHGVSREFNALAVLDLYQQRADDAEAASDEAESIARRALVVGLAECDLQRWRADVAEQNYAEALAEC